jgi:hypothetical protein
LRRKLAWFVALYLAGLVGVAAASYALRWLLLSLG